MSEKLPVINVSPHQLRVYELFLEHFDRDLLVSIARDTSNFMVWRYGAGETMSLDELYRMLSIMLVMCVHSNGDIRDHWSNIPLLQNPFIKETMPSDQFLQLWYNLRFCDARSTNVPTQEEAALDNDEDGDNSTKHEEYLTYSTKYEKEKKIVPTLIRVQTFSRKLQDKWKQAYAKFIPANNKFRYTIDESLLFFYGRVIFKVFNPMKPARFGIEFKVIACTDTNYVIAFEMYCGKLFTRLKSRAIESSSSSYKPLSSIVSWSSICKILNLNVKFRTFTSGQHVSYAIKLGIIEFYISRGINCTNVIKSIELLELTLQSLFKLQRLHVVYVACVIRRDHRVFVKFVILITVVNANICISKTIFSDGVLIFFIHIL
ncbi:Transposase_IS4 [Hexamita inflata]|uniref:Transposase IS4 n=1 Tax=Hexamita inflata TaxID=28002 RepID=A0AA86UNY6_9EUKA|nr:Transposase IS4 [Hexamita inflata]